MPRREISIEVTACSRTRDQARARLTALRLTALFALRRTSKASAREKENIVEQSPLFNER
jgi:hypothetical protein